VLKRLKLVLPIEVATSRQDALVIPDLDNASFQSFAGSAGLRLKMQGFNEVKGNLINVVSVNFTLSLPDSRPPDVTNLGFILTDAKGTEHKTTLVNLNPLLVSTRELEPEDMLWLSGSPFNVLFNKLPWAVLTPGYRVPNRRHWAGLARFSPKQPIGSPVKFTVTRTEHFRTELTFEFHDLPLP
jgi:hypothetical protein